MKCHEKSDESVGPRAFVTAMATGFTAPIALGAAVQQRNALTCTRPRNRVSVNVATVAEAYISVVGCGTGRCWRTGTARPRSSVWRARRRRTARTRSGWRRYGASSGSTPTCTPRGARRCAWPVAHTGRSRRPCDSPWRRTGGRARRARRSWRATATTRTRASSTSTCTGA